MCVLLFVFYFFLKNLSFAFYDSVNGFSKEILYILSIVFLIFFMSIIIFNSIGKENQTESDNKEEEEKEKKCIQEDITETRKFLIAYAFVCIILLCIIIFLCLSIYHLRKGENYYCIKMKHGNLVETSQPQLNDVEAIDISEPKVEVELANTNPQN